MERIHQRLNKETFGKFHGGILYKLFEEIYGKISEEILERVSERNFGRTSVEVGGRFSKETLAGIYGGIPGGILSFWFSEGLFILIQLFTPG